MDLGGRPLPLDGLDALPGCVDQVGVEGEDPTRLYAVYASDRQTQFRC